MAISNKTTHCDPATGECTPGELPSLEKAAELIPGKEIIYVGDPMCSWCWGISNHLRQLKESNPHYKFTIVVGGLRPGGGEAWNDDMKAFLRHHWEEVTKRSGQPFGYQLLDRDEFNYDTEPPCRAVVASRAWVPDQELAFYEAVSRKFYVDNEDPGQLDFYRSICVQFGIDFDAFSASFMSEETKYATYQEFQLNRQWGVRGYPTVLFKSGNQLYQINNGYAEYGQMQQIIDKIVAEEKVVAH